MYHKLFTGVIHCLSFLLVLGCISCEGNNTNSVQLNPPLTIGNSPYPAGKIIYQKICIACHQADGKGIQGTYPPLSGSDYLLSDKFRAIRQVIRGSSGKLIVNGNTFQAVMTPQNLNDSDVALVLDYVYHSFGNNGFTVSPAEVKSVRDTIGK